MSGAAVDVRIDQIFRQSAAHRLDVIYSFPLLSKAAAYRWKLFQRKRENQSHNKRYSS